MGSHTILWLLVGAIVPIVLSPLTGTALMVLRDDDLASTTSDASPLLTSPTPRTVTDERQVRIAAAIPGERAANLQFLD